MSQLIRGSLAQLMSMILKRMFWDSSAVLQFKIGRYIEKTAKDETEAVKWYRKAAEQGNVKAQYAYAVCLQNGTGVIKNETEAIAWYRKAAGQGIAIAQCNLGVCLQKGIGVTIDKVKAVTWFRKSAEQGYAVAQRKLGQCIYNAEGVSYCYPEAKDWLRKAADQGDSEARNLIYRINHPSRSDICLSMAQPPRRGPFG